MLRRCVFLTLVLGLIARGAAQSAPEEVLPAGTLLQCTLDEPNLSSQTAQPGDPILCHASALSVFGSSVFPRGAYLAGHFQDYREPGRFFGKGWINLEFDRLVLPHAVVLPLSAKVIDYENNFWTALVYVCDRQSDRIQVFDKMGNFKNNIWIKRGNSLPDNWGTT